MSACRLRFWPLLRGLFHHHEGVHVKLKATLATTLTASRSDRSDSVRAALTLSSSHVSNGSGAPSKITRRARVAAAVAIVIVAILLVTSGDAHATTGHAFAGSFGGPGEAEGQFLAPPIGVAAGLAGDVFVAEPFAARIDRFTATGTFQSVSPAEGYSEAPGDLAVDSAPAGGEYLSALNTAGTPVVTKFSSAGLLEYTLDLGLSETSFFFGSVVAVDPADGTVYVTASNNVGAQVIDSFSQSTGAFIASFTGSTGSPDGGFGCPSDLAVDPTHHVYVLDPCKARVDKYSAAGTWEATVDDGSRGVPQAVATDPTTGEVYVAEAGVSGLQITNFSAGGTSVLYTFPTANVGTLSGLAVGPDATVYVADRANSVIDRFTAFEGPTVVTEAATELERTSATLNGTVNAEGIASEYHYEYGLENTYGSSTAPVDAGSGTTANAAPAPITGLVPNTTYHYRIVGSHRPDIHDASGPAGSRWLPVVCLLDHPDGRAYPCDGQPGAQPDAVQHRIRHDDRLRLIDA